MWLACHVIRRRRILRGEKVARVGVIDKRRKMVFAPVQEVIVNLQSIVSVRELFIGGRPKPDLQKLFEGREAAYAALARIGQIARAKADEKLLLSVFAAFAARASWIDGNILLAMRHKHDAEKNVEIILMSDAGGIVEIVKRFDLNADFSVLLAVARDPANSAFLAPLTVARIEQSRFMLAAPRTYSLPPPPRGAKIARIKPNRLTRPETERPPPSDPSAGGRYTSVMPRTPKPSAIPAAADDKNVDDDWD